MRMIYSASENLKDFLLSQPETGMGYQVLSPSQKNLNLENFIVVLNSQIVIELKNKQKNPIENKSIDYNDLKDYSVINLTQFISYFDSLRNEQKLSAVDNPLKESTGSDLERFIRLSAFEDDLRVDKINKCFLPGTYSTTLDDFLTMKVNILDNNNPTNNPIVRYSLPVELQIKWMFYIHTKYGDQYRKGKVQPAFGKIGGGIECLFEYGTSPNTLTSVNPY
jgi:hypothetical protein